MTDAGPLVPELLAALRTIPLAIHADIAAQRFAFGRMPELPFIIRYKDHDRLDAAIG